MLYPELFPGFLKGEDVMNKKKLNVITEASLFCAIYAIFALIARSGGGFLESLFFFVLPFPMIFFSLRNDLKSSFLLMISSLILGVLISPLSAIFYIFPSCLIGILYAHFKKKNKSELIQILITIGGCFVVNLLTMHLFAGVFNYDIYDDFGGTINAILRLIDNLFKTNLASNKLIFYIDLLVPSIILVTSMMEGYLMHLVSSLILDKLRYKQRKNLPFFLFQLPIWLGVLSIFFTIIGFLILTLVNKDNGFVFDLYSYILAMSFISYLLLFIQGIAFIACLLLSKNKGKMFIFALLISLLLNILVIIFGIIAIFNDKRDNLLYNVKWKE